MLDSIRRRSRKKRAAAQRRKVVGLLAVGAGVAVLAYLFDRDRGKTRRTQITGRLGGVLRTGTKRAGRTGRRVASDVSGFKDRAIRSEDSPPPNDPALVDKVESEVMGRYPGLSININAEHGVLSLRGEVSSEELRDEIEQEVRKVTGVIDVNNFLHLPGQPAPTK
jgi:osmotically-inducible protein OsmY